MFVLLAGFGLLAWITLLVPLIAMGVFLQIGKEKDSPSGWAIALLFVVLVVLGFWSIPADASFAAIANSIFSWGTVKTVLYYILLGLGYFFVEWLFVTRKESRKIAQSWRDFEEKRFKHDYRKENEFFALTAKEYVGFAKKPFLSILEVGYVKPPPVELREGEIFPPLTADTSTGGADLDVNLNKKSLLYWGTSWVIYWPIYAVLLIVGDLLKELMRAFIDLVHAKLAAITKGIFANALASK